MANQLRGLWFYSGSDVVSKELHWSFGNGNCQGSIL